MEWFWREPFSAKKYYLKSRLNGVSTNKLYVYNKDIIYNPQNPVNPDSEPSVRGKFQLLNPS